MRILLGRRRTLENAKNNTALSRRPPIQIEYSAVLPNGLAGALAFCADDVPFIVRGERGWLLRPNPWQHVIHLYDATGNVTETHVRKGGFKEYLAITR